MLNPDQVCIVPHNLDIVREELSQIKKKSITHYNITISTIEMCYRKLGM